MHEGNNMDIMPTLKKPTPERSAYTGFPSDYLTDVLAHPNSSKSPLAFWRSAVSKPSVNQP